MGKRQTSQVFSPIHGKAKHRKVMKTEIRLLRWEKMRKRDKRGNRRANECEQSIMIYMYENYLMKHIILHANEKY